MPSADIRCADLGARIGRLAGAPVHELIAVGGGHGARHYHARLAGGRELFVKQADPADRDGAARLGAEAAGLRWLGDTATVPVPTVLFWQNEVLALDWVRQAGPDPASAERFGRDLAALHAAGADRFGAPWPGFIASLPLPNEQAASWAPWFAERRLLPYCRMGRDAGVLTLADVRLVESVAERVGQLAGAAGAEPPSRIHGDCWSGNVLWSGGRGWLVDPAAHGGHRESDLAMLALFGAPHLDVILAAYRDAAPLADGWRDRVPLHQLHPLLVHACLFGAAYVDGVRDAARAALRTASSGSG
jgi:fructosamine-3-kinase